MPRLTLHKYILSAMKEEHNITFTMKCLDVMVYIEQLNLTILNNIFHICLRKHNLK